MMSGRAIDPLPHAAPHGATDGSTHRIDERPSDRPPPRVHPPMEPPMVALIDVITFGPSKPKIDDGTALLGHPNQIAPLLA